MQLFDKKLWLFGGAFALFWWFIYGQWNNIVGGFFGVFGSFAQVGIMAVFTVLFVTLYKKLFKQSV